MTALLEVFYQPGKLFASLPERKLAWVAPLIAVVLLTVLAFYLLPHYMGRENLARQQMAMMASRLSPEQMQQAIERSTSPVQIYTGYAFAVVGGAASMLALAGLLMAFGMMTKKAPGYGTMLAMVCLANFPYSIVTVGMTWLTLAISPDPASLDFRNILATNAGAFMNKNETSAGLYSLMTSLDILTFVEIFLLSLGFSKVTKSGPGMGFFAVGVLWIFWVLIKMGLALAFGN